MIRFPQTVSPGFRAFRYMEGTQAEIDLARRALMDKAVVHYAESKHPEIFHDWKTRIKSTGPGIWMTRCEVERLPQWVFDPATKKRQLKSLDTRETWLVVTTPQDIGFYLTHWLNKPHIQRRFKTLRQLLSHIVFPNRNGDALKFQEKARPLFEPPMEAAVVTTALANNAFCLDELNFCTEKVVSAPHTGDNGTT